MGASGGDGEIGGSANGRPILLFDGVCNLCNGLVQFVIERDPDGEIRFGSLQWDVADELLADATVDPDDLDTVVLLEDGQVYTKSTAALRVARRLDSPWSTLGGLLLVPRPIRDAAYDLVAATRYDVFGRRDRCMVPSPDLEERFLDSSPDDDHESTSGS